VVVLFWHFLCDSGGGLVGGWVGWLFLFCIFFPLFLSVRFWVNLCVVIYICSFLGTWGINLFCGVLGFGFGCAWWSRGLWGGLGIVFGGFCESGSWVGLGVF